MPSTVAIRCKQYTPARAVTASRAKPQINTTLAAGWSFKQAGPEAVKCSDHVTLARRVVPIPRPEPVARSKKGYRQPAVPRWREIFVAVLIYPICWFFGAAVGSWLWGLSLLGGLFWFFFRFLV